MPSRLLVLAIASAVALPALATDERTALTLYRAQGDALFATDGDAISNDGYAVVHERRAFDLNGGTQDLAIDGLPAALDSEALSLRFPGNGARAVSQRLLLGQGFDGAVAGLVGHEVTAIGSTGQPIATGTLVRGGDTLVIREAGGQASLVRSYTALRATGTTDFARGSTLQVRVAGGSAGHVAAQLDYPTSGLGWRGAYVATVAAGTSCRMTFDASASIANRSGRDWKDVSLKLIAGDANRAKSIATPRVYMARAMAAPAPPAPPADMEGMEQATLGDLRTYTLPAAMDLPDGSVTRTPLYDSRTLDCKQEAVYDAGARFYGDYPIASPRATVQSGGTIESTLEFNAFDSLPAGYLRVLTVDRDGNAELLGEGRLADTPKNREATISLGTAFDLTAKRAQTSFSADAAALTMDEGTRITLSNASNTKRVVTVREHASRWRAWTLISSSVKPTKTSPESLEFEVEVPANGSVNLDYAVRYSFTKADIKQ